MKSKFFMLLLLLIGVVSCESDDNSQFISGTNSIADYLRAHDEFSLFSKAVERAGLAATLDGNAGTYTVLAPDNTAMEAYLQAHGYASVEAIPVAKVENLVEYHVLDVLTQQANFVTGYLTTLAGLPVNDSVETNLSLYVVKDDSLAFNGEVHIVDGDIPVDNGILHHIDHTLDLPTLQTFMTADANLKPYYDLLTAADITTDFDSVLTDTNRHHTILVPNAAAVEAFSAEAGQFSPEERNAIYRYQWLDTMRTTKTLSSGYLLTNAHETYSGHQQRLSMYVNTETGVRLNGAAEITTSDLMTINGNIQVIDSVLTLPTAGTFVAADTQFKTFAGQLVRDDQQANGYMTILNGDVATSSTAPVTVFAPTDKAFEEVIAELYPDQVMEADSIPTAEMTGLLNLHIIPNQSLRSAGFVNQNLQSLGGNVAMNASEQTLTDPAGRTAKIKVTDAQAINGVVQSLEKVLLPQ